MTITTETITTEQFKELLAKLDPFTQLDIANEIRRRFNIFNPNLTPDDALMRISEEYDCTGNDPEKLALEFFSTPRWKKAVEDAEDTFWEDSGIEILNEPLHEWLEERGINHRNSQTDDPSDETLETADCDHQNLLWVYDRNTPGAWSPLNIYDAVCTDCDAKLRVPERQS